MTTITYGSMSKPTDYLLPHSHIIIEICKWGDNTYSQYAWTPEAWYSRQRHYDSARTAYFIVRPKLQS